jgi:hypothetical protein
MRKFSGLLLECPREPEAAASRQITTPRRRFINPARHTSPMDGAVKKHSGIQIPIGSMDPEVTQCLASECS